MHLSNNKFCLNLLLRDVITHLPQFSTQSFKYTKPNPKLHNTFIVKYI